MINHTRPVSQARDPRQNFTAWPVGWLLLGTWTGMLVLSCSSETAEQQDATTDVRQDMARDRGLDASIDLPRDMLTDRLDGPLDQTPLDLGEDLADFSAADVAQDQGVDAPLDLFHDMSVDSAIMDVRPPLYDLSCSDGMVPSASLWITRPDNQQVQGVRTAVTQFPRFGTTVTIPYLQSTQGLATAMLEVEAEIYSCTCPTSIRWTVEKSGSSPVQSTTAVTCGSTMHLSQGTIALEKGEYTLTAEALDSSGAPILLEGSSINSVAQVGIGDVYLILGESTSEGYGSILGDGIYKASALFPMDRWDHVPPGTISSDGRTFPQIGATSVDPTVSGCGAPPSDGCPVKLKAQSPPYHFSGYGKALADQLLQRLGYPVFILNLAYGGHTTASLLRTPDMGLLHPGVTEQIDALKPSHALIFTGVNDSICPIFCMDATCLALCKDNLTDYQELVSWAAQQVGDVKRVFLGDPTPYPPSAPTSSAALVAAATAARAASGARRGPEIYHFFLHYSSLLASDNVHPSTSGYAALGPLWADKIVTPRDQAFPHLSFLPASTGSPATGLLAITGATPLKPLSYWLVDPLGVEAIRLEPLSCGATTSPPQHADDQGTCSYAYQNLVLSPSGTWTGTIKDESGVEDSAVLTVVP